MVQAVRRLQNRYGMTIDSILCVGDFQTPCDEKDMQCMACPERYMEMGDYSTYDRGEKDFPVEILFTGGNYEAYNLLNEYPVGGMISPKCFYLGRQGACERHGLRIAGLSGVFSPGFYDHGRPQINWASSGGSGRKTKRQATYFTQEEVNALSAATKSDVRLLYDWLSALSEYADPHDRGGTPRSGMGKDPARLLLETLKPRGLFCGHVHWYFRGDFHWPGGQTTTFICLDQIAAARDRHMAVLHTENDRDWQLPAPQGL